MGENRRIAINSFFLYIRLVVVTIVGLFSSRIVLQQLGASDFGLYNVVGGIVVLMNLLNTAMLSTSFRFIAFEMGKKDVAAVNSVFNVSLAIHFALAGALIILSETVGVYYIHRFLNVPPEKISDAVFVFRFSVAAAICSILTVPHQGLITALEEFGFRSAVEIFQAVFRLGAAIALIYWGENKLRLYAVLTAVAIGLSCLGYVAYCYRRFGEYVRLRLQKDIKRYGQMLDFSFWILLGAVACVGKVQGAALIINYFFGTVVNAAFAIANQVNQIVLMFTQNLGQAAIPQITKSYSGGDRERSFRLVAYMTKYSFFLMLLPSLPILLETEFLLKLWLKDVPAYTVTFTRLIILCALVECLNSAMSTVAQTIGKIRTYQAVFSFFSVFSLVASYLYFYIFKRYPHALLLLYLLALILNGLVNLLIFHLKKFLPVSSFIKIVYIRIAYILLVTVPLLWNIRHLIKDAWITIVADCMIYLIAIFWVGLEREEKNYVLVRADRIFRILKNG